MMKNERTWIIPYNVFCSCSYDCFCSGNYHDIHFGSSGTGQSSFGHTTYSENPINFLGNAKYALPTLVIISLWKDCGTYMIYWLAGLQGVSKDVYEAATIDGANRRQTFFHIVLPLIAPTGGIIAILCAINSLKVFDIVKTMTEGGPYYATDVIATYVYRTAFSSEIGMPRLGYASAAALFFGGAVIIIGILLNAMKDRLQKNVQ